MRESIEVSAELPDDIARVVRIFLDDAANRHFVPEFNPKGKEPRSGAQAEVGSMTVFVDVNAAKQVGDVDHIKVFASVEAAEIWFEENDPEGVAFEYDVIGPPA
ncbi:hypothetical protein [Bradyrhizobium sp. AZCC 2230]|uniref:hypothetical protein n=1 Tax=Bradyrhizobium sp. AZCC 2230 TaxID=3117021 RepID=UPI002FF181D3